MSKTKYLINLNNCIILKSELQGRVVQNKYLYFKNS